MRRQLRKVPSPRKTVTRYQPYDDRQGLSIHNRNSSRRSNTSSPTVSVPCPANSPEATLRDAHLQYIRQRYPNVKPRNDYDILALSDGKYKGPDEEIYAWLDARLAARVAFVGNADLYLRNVTRILDSPGSITGLKPQPRTGSALVHPIPHTEYSIRLFSGSLVLREYCMDFVRTSTGEAVNSPFSFELWSVPQSFTSDPLSSSPMQIFSLEHRWGMLFQDIPEGKEKFVLSDGRTYVLKREGQRNLRFTVPFRKSTRHISNRRDDDYTLDFPAVI